jgi:hypothetical protein
MTDAQLPPASRPAAPPPARARSAAIWIAVAAATIALIAGSAFLLRRSGLLETTPGPSDLAVAVDDQYVVFLSQIEVENGNADGGKWDATDGGPDVRYDIYWRGNRIFRSSVRTDTLVARWDQDEIGIRDLIQGVSAERSLKAARITAQHGEKLEFRVVDDDALKNDEIGKWEVSVESLHTGDQTWKAPAPGIRQAVCRVVRVDEGR